MQTSETRYINQCTHSQIIPLREDNNDENKPHDGDKEAFPSGALVKNGILGSVFEEPEPTELLIGRVVAKADEDHSHEEIAQAARYLIAGDPESCGQLLAQIKTDKIIQFCEKVLTEEANLLDKAAADVELALAAVAERVRTKAGLTDEIRDEISALRANILEEVRGLIIPEALEAIRSSTGPEETIRALGGSRGALTRKYSVVVTDENPPISEAKSAHFVDDENPFLSVDWNAIEAEIDNTSPNTGQILRALKFFPLTKPAPSNLVIETATVMSFMDIQKMNVNRKTELLRGIVKLTRVEPAGYLHLERLNFTPIGYVRGELVYSIPMLPGETVRLSHREWSRTEKEYEKLVAASMETATQEALSEKSELTQSVSSEEQHTSAFNASASVSGEYGKIKFSSNVGYKFEDSNKNTREFAAQRSQEVTKKASSRAKREHKMSFRVTTEYEIEEQSFREIKNESDQAVRYDFHRLMKKWRIDLYRYGVRLTYDVTIPEPGGYLLRKYVQLQRLNEELLRPNPFDLSPTSITFERTSSAKGTGMLRAKLAINSPNGYESLSSPSATDWTSLSEHYGASLDPPPTESIRDMFQKEIRFIKKPQGDEKTEQAKHTGFLEIHIPDGYELDEILDVEKADAYDEKKDGSKLCIRVDTKKEDNRKRFDAAKQHSRGKFIWIYEYEFIIDEVDEANIAHIYVEVQFRLSRSAFREWQMQCYERLSDAAQADYENRRQRLMQQRDALTEELGREDALVLRKIEKEELMKGVLRWVLGPRFDFYPKALPQLRLSQTRDLGYYHDKDSQSIKADNYWSAMLQHGEIIRFLHQAIEWENINYVLYPYFWTDDERWDFKQSLYHEDYVHRSFLRAGAARVVLTIRPGFEAAFLAFTTTLDLKSSLTAETPYTTIAQEIENAAKTQYPYTLSANKEGKKNFVKTWYEFTPTGALDVMEGGILEPEEDLDDDIDVEPEGPPEDHPRRT